MLSFSSRLSNHHSAAAANLTAALDAHNIPYRFLPNAKDIWLRDFMPVWTDSRKLVSFRYEPSYLKNDPDLRTDFRKDLAPQLGLPVTYSHINLDGGNVVFSPSGARVLISDRVFSENPERPPAVLVRELSELLEAEVLIIPSLKSDMTGHADGMARFLDDRTVLCNRPLSSCGFEQKVKRSVRDYGLDAEDFPFVPTGGISAVGCYLNYLETEQTVSCRCLASSRMPRPKLPRGRFSIRKSSPSTSGRSPNRAAV